jgi:PAS domain S-box-containing protein
MQREENLLLEQRAAESRESYRIAILSIVLPAIMGIVLLGVVFYLVQRSLAERQAAAELLGEQRERFRVTLASIGDAVITTDTEARVTYLNHAAEVITGWTGEEARGRQLGEVFNIVNEETRMAVENPALRVLQEGLTVGLANHTVLIGRDGADRPIDDSAAPIRDEEGRIRGCVLIFRDITQRRRMERLSAERSAMARHLASIVESSEDAIIGVSLNGTIQSWNAAAERLYGYTPEEAVGKPIAMLIPSDRADEEDRLIARILAGERIAHFDTVRLTRTGRALDVSLTLSAVRDDQDRIIGTSKTVRDITEAKQAEKRIYGLMADLKEADRRKDEFLAILAHELRGPLAPIRHLLEIIKRSEQHPERLRQATDTMDRQLAQMVRLVDDLLDVSRITRNKLELRRERTDVADVLNQAVQLGRPYAERQQHQVTVDLPQEPLLVNGDPVRLAQVFSNLLQNAYKYTEPGGRIWVSATRQGSDARITIRDTGVGIPQDLLPRIFDLFIQVEETLERAHGGLGIGLTLVKQLVLMHDGTVEAHSEGPGKGSEFVVRLPLMLEAHESHRTLPAVLDEHQVATHRILLVDDNRDSVESLAMLLKMLGHETHVGYDGQQAVELAERLKPDLMLLDIGLPKLNGFEACRKIREQPWGRSILIVALSGWGQDADRKQSDEAGFDYHMVKPLDYTLLMRVLSTVGENGDRKSGEA